MAKLNARLEGRTFTDCYGQRATVVESMEGLRAGYVCVRGHDGRQSVENLRYVLSSLDDPEPDLVLAASLLAQADALRERAMSVAGAAATRKMDRNAATAALAFHSSMDAALDAARSAEASSQRETGQAAEAEAEPAPAGMRI